MAFLDVSASKSLQWDYNECVLRTYRVQGDCKPPPADCTLPCTNPGNTQSYIVNVTACDVEDVCRRLRDRAFVRTIRTIEQFGSPVFRNGQPPKASDYCLTDVTPVLDSCDECCDFLVDENARVRAHMDMEVHEGYSYPVHGEVVLSGETGLPLMAGGSPNWQYDVTGTVLLTGGTGTQTDGQPGLVAAAAQTVEAAIEVGVVFPTDPAPALGPVTTIVDIPDCCASGVPAALLLTHNLDQVYKFRQFLLRNGLACPGASGGPRLSCCYSTPAAGWVANVHLAGTAVDGPGTEHWDVVFRAACEGDGWVSSVLLARTTTAGQQVSRLAATVPPLSFCPFDLPFSSFEFFFNVKTGAVSPAGTAVFHDDLAFFTGSPSFKKNPELRFRLARPSAVDAGGSISLSVP